MALSLFFLQPVQRVKRQCKFWKGECMFGIYSARRLILLIIFAVIIAMISGISTYMFVKYIA
ncbi:putative membrane protein [Citrobacter rodentium ICC168]|uniref:Membrane protein n=1 Tax=Citrobacter rodentium (strain ICC168) TaxID=637910 RepID=D2TPW4_CITRI|nr:putative membrane protein [Citrobacter rodentium ICC168]